MYEKQNMIVRIISNKPKRADNRLKILIPMKTITQSHFINATPEEVYLALTNPLTIELWSGYPADMQPVEGTEFALFEGDITGMNIHADSEQKGGSGMVFRGQSREVYCNHNHLKASEGGTHVDLEHTNIPDEEIENMGEGWKSYYLGRDKEIF